MFPTAPQPIQARSGTIEEASISAWYIDCQCPGENNLLPTLLVECAAWGAGKALTLQLVGLGSMAFLRPACARHSGGVEEARFWGKVGKGGQPCYGSNQQPQGHLCPSQSLGDVCVCVCVRPVIALQWVT